MHLDKQKTVVHGDQLSNIVFFKANKHHVAQKTKNILNIWVSSKSH